REPQRAVDASRSQWRDCARRITDEQRLIIRDVPQTPVHRNETAATLDRFPDAEPSPQLRERRQGIESISISGHTDVRIDSVVDVPRDVSRRQARIDETMQRRRAATAGDDILDTNQKFAILIETERARDDR